MRVATADLYCLLYTLRRSFVRCLLKEFCAASTKNPTFLAVLVCLEAAYPVQLRQRLKPSLSAVDRRWGNTVCRTHLKQGE